MRDEESERYAGRTQVERISTPFVCTICQKTYTRSEHLARHYRSHTRERPFICETCGKGFSRRDLLRRHFASHGTDEQQASASKGGRKIRVRNACGACVDAKLGCSDTRPCDRCVGRGLPCGPPAQAATIGQQHAVPSNFVLDYGQLDEPSSVSSFEPPQQEEYNLHQSNVHNSITLSQGDGTMYHEAPDPFFSIESAFDDILMGNFLHDIVVADHSDSQLRSNGPTVLPDVLHYGYDEFAEISSSFVTSIPSSALVHPPISGADNNMSGIGGGGTETPAVRRAVHAGEQAFRDSMWLWDPSMEESNVSEQILPTLPRDQAGTENQPRYIDPSLRLSATSRDRILSMILRTCEPRVQRQVVSCFPSSDFLSSLLADFHARHVQQISPWIHFPTLNLDNECEEFLAALVCAGAADSRRPEIRRLGFALQEAARLAIIQRFEEDNKHHRDLRSIQALLVVLNVGLNSASRRKIEIAESLTLSVITMLRRGGRFRNNWNSLSETHNDEPQQTLHMRWRKWVEEESFKRLAYHVLFQDVQTSSALFRQPVLSYSEINLTMPCSEDLWLAESDETWRQKLWARQAKTSSPSPMLSNCLQDPGLLSLHRTQIDLQMSLRVIVSVFWLRVWQFMQLRSFFSSGDGSVNLVTINQSRQQLIGSSQDLSVRFSGGSEMMHPCVKMMLELGLMHLHVSLEDIQNLAGKEGEEQAREAASRLRAWIRLPECRQALFHAGQIAKVAADCTPQYLRGFHAVVIYQASLTMWAHALLATSLTSALTERLQSVHDTLSLVRVDADETPELRRFILLGNATACIRSYSERDDGSNQEDNGTVLLTDAADVMMSMAALLSSRDKNEFYCIPIASYLTRLMHSLAKASAAMKLLR